MNLKTHLLCVLPNPTDAHAPLHSTTTWQTELHTIRYDTVYSTCSHKLTCRWGGIKQKI